MHGLHCASHPHGVSHGQQTAGWAFSWYGVPVNNEKGSGAEDGSGAQGATEGAGGGLSEDLTAPYLVLRDRRV